MVHPSSVLPPPPRTETPLGQSIERNDARAKCSGEAQYLSDISVPGMLHAKVLRSPIAHARIVFIDAAAAASIKGVVRVITAADLPESGARYGHILRDQPILADGVVRYAGEPVAIVVAIDEATAAEALEQIEVDYYPLPVVSLDTAMDPDSPLLHDQAAERGFLKSALVDAQIVANTCYEYADLRGDPEGALAAADYVVEHEYTFPSVYQYAMEPHGAIAQNERGTLTVRSSCQHPFLVRRELSVLFGLDLDQVRVIVPFVGGGFGSKSYTTIEPLVCLAAMLVVGPVRLVNTVEESIQTSRQHNMRCWMQTAASKDGKLLLRRARIFMDTGAYATNGPTVTFMTGLSAPGPYIWSSVDVMAACVYTTRSPSGSYRGFGSSHTQWISESQIDEIAAVSGRDRFDLRRSNLLRRGDLIHPRMKPLDADLHDSFDRVVSALHAGRPTARPGRTVGQGFGFGVIPAGAEPTANALVRIRRDGRVTVLVGTTEMGQGARTVFAQIASHTLAVPFEVVAVPGTDTKTTPYDRSTGASRSTTLVGLAVERAATNLLAQLSDLAGRVLNTDPAMLSYEDGLFRGVDQEISLRNVLDALNEGGDELTGHGRVGIGIDRSDFPVFWEVCAGGATVEVDCATGGVSVLATVTAVDVGKAINPSLVAVQDSGCTMQALGHTLFEELEYTDDQELLTSSLVHYHVPTIQELPDHMSCLLVENADGPGPFGAKGCGEGAFGAIPAAIVTALREAGAEIYDLPATPERVWASIHPA